MTDSHWRRLRVATYNVHRCRGLDGRTNPARTAEVIRAIDADIVALQEVIGAGPHSEGHAAELGAQLGMGWVMASVRHLRKSLFGNVVLSRLPILHHAQYDLSWKTCEPRCVQSVDIAIDNDTLHLYNVHLGTAFLERRYQASRLSAIVHDRRLGRPKIVLGDFNEWNPTRTPLVRHTDGTWSVTLSLPPGRYRFSFLVDGQSWRADPARPSVPDPDFQVPTSLVRVEGSLL